MDGFEVDVWVVLRRVDGVEVGGVKVSGWC